jgi:hypothetical protein
MIEALHRNETHAIRTNLLPSPFRLELLAALERVLCFCHTGSTAVLATSLMNPLGLSRAAVKDGFPMLMKIFKQPTIASAMLHGAEIDVREWPVKDGYPAIASRRTQELTYSPEHFMVRRFISFQSTYFIAACVTFPSCAALVWTFQERPLFKPFTRRA